MGTKISYLDDCKYIYVMQDAVVHTGALNIFGTIMS